MRRFGVVGVAVSLCVLGFAGGAVAADARTAALQIGLRAHGFDPGPVDGVRGPLTTQALRRFQRANGLVPDGRGELTGGPRTPCERRGGEVNTGTN